MCACERVIFNEKLYKIYIQDGGFFSFCRRRRRRFGFCFNKYIVRSVLKWPAWGFHSDFLHKCKDTIQFSYSLKAIQKRTKRYIHAGKLIAPNSFSLHTIYTHWNRRRYWWKSYYQITATTKQYQIIFYILWLILKNDFNRPKIIIKIKKTNEKHFFAFLFVYYFLQSQSGAIFMPMQLLLLKLLRNGSGWCHAV